MKLFKWFFDWGHGGLIDRIKSSFQKIKPVFGKVKNIKPFLKQEKEFVDTAEEINTERDKQVRKILAYAGHTVFFLAILGLAAHFIGVAAISGDSMDPTLKNGQHVILDKTSDPEPGDIIVFERNDRRLVKRVIATGGDMVEISAGEVMINGKTLDEPYAVGYSGNLAETTVPEGSLFVMGDNREHSWDSRDFGTVPAQDALIGIVMERGE